MQALAIGGRRRLIQAIHQTLSITFRYQNQPPLLSFFGSEATNKFLGEDMDSEQEKPKCLSLRIERLARGEPVGFAFQSWMSEGFPIHRGEIFHTINRLRKRKLNKRALEVIYSA